MRSRFVRSLASNGQQRRKPLPLIRPLHPALTAIELSPVASASNPLLQPTLVYVLKGADSVVLINSGHQAQQAELVAALTQLGVHREDVERIVITGVWPDLYGGIELFEGADVCTLAATQVHVDRALQGAATDLKGRLASSAASIWPGGPPPRVRTFLDDYLTIPGRTAHAVGLTDGLRLNLAGFLMEVMATPGHLQRGLSLFEPSEGWVFSGDLVQITDGTCWTTDPDQTMQSFEALERREAKQLMPNRGLIGAANVALTRGGRTVMGFMTNMPTVVNDTVTPIELVARDLTMSDANSLRFLLFAQGYAALLELLVQTGTFAVEGQGLTARYRAARQ